MKNKNAVKVFLTVFLSTTMAAIVILAGFYVYKISADKASANSESSAYQSENTLKAEDAQKLAKQTLESYIPFSYFENSDIGPTPYLLVRLGLETEDSINSLTSEIYDATTYIKSNTKYSDFKEKLLEFVSEEYFTERFSQYKNIDGYVGICGGGAGYVSISAEKITLLSSNKNKYKFNVIFKDIEMYEHFLNPQQGENITQEDYLFNSEVSFEYINGKMLISNW